MSKVIALTGMPASGKGEVSNIAKERGWAIHRIGALVWAETERRGLELTPSNVGKVANGERETHGMDIWAIRSIPIIKDLLANGSNVLIDGMRGIPEQETFKSSFGDDLVPLAVTSSFDIRLTRAMSRKRIDDSAESDFRERDKRELSWNLKEAIASAERQIINEDSLEEYHSKIHIFLAEMEST